MPSSPFPFRPATCKSKKTGILAWFASPRLHSLLFSLGVAPWGGLLLEGAAHAQDAATSGPGDIVVWYRASESCPVGEDFVQEIRVSGRVARLAKAGDHPDYVITLDSDGLASVGRLERQTNQGTIAISSLRGGACDEVAAGLSLSLALAVAPGPSNPSPSVEDELVEPAEEASPALQGVDPEARVDTPRSEENFPKARSTVVSAPSAHASPRSQRQWWVGGGLDGAVGMTPSLSGGGHLFVQYDFPWLPKLGPASLRVGPRVLGSRTEVPDFGRVTQWTTTLGLEFCPVWLSAGSFSVAPCMLSENGLFAAWSDRDTSLTSVKYWGSLGPGLRASSDLSEDLYVGFLLSVMAPLSRHEFRAGEDALIRTPPAVFLLSAELLWKIP